jgi:hypothetical protein
MNHQQKLAAAENPNTPIKILEVLSTDGYPVVRYGVAKNPNTPTTALEQLATDKNYWIRYSAAMNPKATEIVKRLYLMTEANYNSK